MQIISVFIYTATLGISFGTAAGIDHPNHRHHHPKLLDTFELFLSAL